MIANPRFIDLDHLTHRLLVTHRLLLQCMKKPSILKVRKIPDVVGAYQLRRRREALIEQDRAPGTFVVDRLAEGWTPEQISGWLKGGNERRLRAVSCETIYAFIYWAAQRAEQLWRYLTRRHKRRRPRRSRPSQDTIKDRVSIHERPKTVDGRTEGGHWEGDLIICKRTRPVLVLHERKSRVTLAARLAGKTAAETISVMLAVFARIEPALRKSITFDNDTAFAQHALLRTMRAMTTWFCDAYASWQKGGIENANGRLRRWLPRQIDIDQISDEEIQDIVITANLTPRKCLGFKTPFQAILKELGKDVQIRFASLLHLVLEFQGFNLKAPERMSGAPKL
jgi:transposase, IS30 family